jgi:HSP20 family molecular chaperone IbpA
VFEGATLKISYTKPHEERGDDDQMHPGMIHNGLSKKSFDLRYKIAPKFDLTQIDAALTNGLLEIFIPLAEEAKPKSIKIK